jgi:O-antigen/teichoic acid export membrane protein
VNVIRRLCHTQLRLNMVSGVITMLLRMVILFLSYPLYIGLLGYETYGIWIVLSTVLSFSQLGELGIGEATTKFVAEAYGQKNVDDVNKYVVSSQAILLVSGLILCTIIVVLRDQIVDLFNLAGGARDTALSVLPYVGALSIYVFIVHISTAALSGLGRMDLANYIELLGRLISLGLSLFLLWMNRGIMALIIANAVAYFLVHMASMVAAWRIVRLAPFCSGALSLLACKRLLRYGSGVLGITVLSMMSDPFNKIVVTRYVGLSSVVLYEIATRTGAQIKAVCNPALRALMPEVSRLGGVETRDALTRVKKINRKTAKFMLLGMGPIYVVMLHCARPVLELWLRHSFNDALPSMFRIVLTASYVNLLGGPAYYTLMGLGRVHFGLVAHILKATVNVGSVIAALALWRPLTASMVVIASLIASVVATLYLLLNEHRTVSHAVEAALPMSSRAMAHDAM